MYEKYGAWGKPKFTVSKEWSPPLEPTAADWAWWKRCAAEAGGRADELTSTEREFVEKMAKWRGRPSEKQLAWLISIFRRLFGEAPAS
jgi:hypothetical protein